jgi:hypothetical protein
MECGIFLTKFQQDILFTMNYTPFRASCSHPRVLTPLLSVPGLLRSLHALVFQTVPGDNGGQDFVARLLVIACFLHASGHKADAIGPVR